MVDIDNDMVDMDKDMDMDMDMNKDIEIRIPSITQLNGHITEIIKKEVKNQIEDILYRISKGEDIPLEHLKAYVPDINDVCGTNIKPVKRKIDQKEQCQAKVNNGDRCSRRCKPPHVYCGGHTNSRPYGQIENE